MMIKHNKIIINIKIIKIILMMIKNNKITKIILMMIKHNKIIKIIVLLKYKKYIRALY